MTPPTPKHIFLSILAFPLVFSLAACGQDLTPIIVPTLTDIPIPSTTPVPPAISVNGEGISTADFQAELARYQQAQAGLGNVVTLETATQAVKNDLVDMLLLEQGAASQNFVVDDATLQARVDALAAQAGGMDALAAWETAHGYSDAAFRSELRLEIAAAWMRDQLTASVPGTADQVHVKQILLYNEGEAQQVLGDLQAGGNFTDLAAKVRSGGKRRVRLVPAWISSLQSHRRCGLCPSTWAGIVPLFKMRPVITFYTSLSVTLPFTFSRCLDDPAGKCCAKLAVSTT